MLPDRHRLRRTVDIQRVRQKGRRWHHPLLTLYTHSRAAPDGEPHSRFAISVSRHVGNAVIRNRSKRRIREALRSCLPQIDAGRDCLFVARNTLANASYTEVDQAVRQLLCRAGLISATSESEL